MISEYKNAAEIIRNAKHVIAFTGAGISVESGIPPFRGEAGLWNKYDPSLLEIGSFLANPEKSWKVIREIFYDKFADARPNEAHLLLSRLESNRMLKSVITQNIDNLHQEAGSKTVYEFHGNSRKLMCMGCREIYQSSEINLNVIPPMCESCGELLKPDFIFFGEPIPEKAYIMSVKEANAADVILVIGASGEVIPAGSIPYLAKKNGAMVIEINPGRSNYTDTITDIFIQSKAIKAAIDLGKKLAI